MMEERYHATTQNRFYPDMSNVNENITVETKLISPPMYIAMGRFENCINGFETKYDIERTGFSTNSMNIAHSV